MKFLLDTHLLIWLTTDVKRVPPYLLEVLEKSGNEFTFIVASIWEVAIKQTLPRKSPGITAERLRGELVRREFASLPITTRHALAVPNLAAHHGDPFDRILIAQAIVEELIFLTSDEMLTLYEGPVRLL